MSQFLTFQESLWNSAKSAAIQAQFPLALQKLQPLLATDPTSHYYQLARRLAGRIYSAQERFKKARKMFWSVLRVERQCSQTWYDLGVAYEKDPYGSDEQAVRCFRRALQTAPDCAKTRAALGRGLVRLNRVGAGVRKLMEAMPQADVSVLKVIIYGLLEADQPRRAQSFLRSLDFALQRDPTVQRLFQDVRYALAASGQAQARQRPRSRNLPFLRIATEGPSDRNSGPILRFDNTASTPRPHFQQKRRG